MSVIREVPDYAKQNIGFTCSSFDLLHAGHILMLEECKRYCKFLCVGLQTDPTIDRPDKNKPIQSILERYLQLDAIEHVDCIYPYDTEADLLKLLKIIRLQIRFVGEDWREKDFTGKEITDIRIHYNKRYGYSTSELRTRVAESAWEAAQ